jgi:hypothetical protein
MISPTVSAVIPPMANIGKVVSARAERKPAMPTTGSWSALVEVPKIGPKPM